MSRIVAFMRPSIRSGVIAWRRPDLVDVVDDDAEAEEDAADDEEPERVVERCERHGEGGKPESAAVATMIGPDADGLRQPSTRQRAEQHADVAEGEDDADRPRLELQPLARRRGCSTAPLMLPNRLSGAGAGGDAPQVRGWRARSPTPARASCHMLGRLPVRRVVRRRDRPPRAG